MWRTLKKEEEKEFLQKAIELTSDAELYSLWMMEVVVNWHYSCEHNLTCSGMNRLAWIGQAACAMAINCPEYITRIAWNELSQEQQDRANLNAFIAIELWEEEYAKNKTRN